MRSLIVALTALALAGCGGPSGGADVTFTGKDAYDFGGMADAAPRTIEAKLYLPPGDGPVAGAAILSHGSGGTGSRQDRMAGILLEAGFAALVVDHFGPRSIGSTVEDQLRVTAQGMMTDAFAARDLLAQHPRIPADKIGIIGWSKGGIVASLAAVDRLAGFASDERMAFAIAFYPFCGYQLDEETLASPLLYLIGDQDDWTPAGPCVRQAEAWAANGQPAEVVVYPGARHGFDSRAPDLTIGRAITVRDTSPRCTLTVDAAGNTVALEGGLGLETLERRREYLEVCGVRGVGFGGNSDARAASTDKVLGFIRAALAD
ncbi:MAG: dienelactone hydrolase family protein [Pseudomonadota bacterium]